MTDLVQDITPVSIEEELKSSYLITPCLLLWGVRYLMCVTV